MAFTAYITFPNITGESAEQGRGGAIQLDSFNWGVSNSTSALSGSGAGAGKASFQDFAFTANVGAHSSQLFLAVVQARRFANAVLSVSENGAQLFQITFSDVFISNYKIDESGTIGVGLADAAVTLKIVEPSSAQLAKPVESVSFSFTRVEFQIGGGGISTGTVG